MPMAQTLPQPLGDPGETTVNPWSQQSLGVPLMAHALVAGAAAAWPVANLVIYIPFSVPEPIVATKMFYGIGAAAGNIDMGIYAESGTRLVSLGSTAAAGAATIQVGDITDTLLPRGRYYLALVCDTVTTLTVHKATPAVGIAQSLGLLQQAGVTLPLSTNANPATFAKYAQAYLPLVGLQGYRTVGP